MARLRVRVRFNPGRIGSPLDKLGEFATQVEKFLRALGTDLGADSKKGHWVAQNFGNESVSFDNELPGAPDGAISLTRDVLRTLTGDHPLDACNKGMIGYGTVAEFARIGKVLDPDEKFIIGIYADGEASPAEWRDVTYEKTVEMRRLLDAPLVSYGSVQGTLHAWHPGASPPFLIIRELSSGALVHCVYAPELYDRVHAATKAPNTIIHAYGDVRWDRAIGAVIEMDIQNIEASEPLSPSEFEKIFGSIPQFTGDRNTAAYIEWRRGDAD